MLNNSIDSYRQFNHENEAQYACQNSNLDYKVYTKTLDKLYKRILYMK